MPISRLPHPILPQCLTPRIYVLPLGICLSRTVCINCFTQHVGFVLGFFQQEAKGKAVMSAAH